MSESGKAAEAEEDEKRAALPPHSIVNVAMGIGPGDSIADQGIAPQQLN